MDPVSNILQAFKLASPHQRQQVLCACIEHLNDDEAVSLANFLSWKRSRLDILSNLPKELQLCVIDHLEINDIYIYTLVCRAWRDLFLGSSGIVDYLLSKWFPLYGKESVQEKSQLLSHAVRKQYFRATGRFRSRMTMPLRRLVNGQFPVARLEHLRHGCTYVDLACSASSAQYSWIQPQRLGTTGILTRYANGRLAWQPRTTASAIVIHDFHTNEQKEFTHPLQTLVAGLNMYLIALGNKLVIGVSERTLIAWDIESGSRTEIRLPNMATGCTTQDDSVLVTVRGGHLFMWESLSRLIEIDTTRPPEQGLRPKRMLAENVGHHNPPLFFHPTDRTTFFVSCLCGQPPITLRVYEFKLRNREYRSSRSFSYDLKPHLLSRREVSSRTRLLDRHDIRKADARGTFELLRIELTIDVNYGRPCHVQCITFNALTTLFSMEVYQSPSCWSADLPERSCIWAGQLVHPWLGSSGFNPSPALVVLNQCKSFRSLVEASLYPPDQEFNRVMDDILEGAAGGKSSSGLVTCEVVRQRDIKKANPTAPDCHSVYGFQYVLSLRGNSCTCTENHKPSCQSSHLNKMPSMDTPTHYPLNHAACISQSGDYRDICTATTVFADDDFLVVVTNWDTYTVFSVDMAVMTVEALEVGKQNEAQRKPGGLGAGASP